MNTTEQTTALRTVLGWTFDATRSTTGITVTDRRRVAMTERMLKRGDRRRVAVVQSDR